MKNRRSFRFFTSSTTSSVSSISMVNKNTMDLMHGHTVDHPPQTPPQAPPRQRLRPGTSSSSISNGRKKMVPLNHKKKTTTTTMKKKKNKLESPSSASSTSLDDDDDDDDPEEEDSDDESVVEDSTTTTTTTIAMQPSSLVSSSSSTTTTPSSPRTTLSASLTTNQGSSSQRFIIHGTSNLTMNSWNMFSKNKDISTTSVLLACLETSKDHDTMILNDYTPGGHCCCAIIVPTTTTNNCAYEYTIQYRAPCPIDLDLPVEAEYATIRAHQPTKPTSTTTSFQFSCTTNAGRHFVADQILWSTLQGRAFCIHEQERPWDVMTATTLKKRAARITNVTAQEREILVYPTVDPLLMMAFLAVMEEVILISNL